MGARQEEARGGKVSLGKRRPQVFREGPRAEEPGDHRPWGLYVHTHLTGEMECLATGYKDLGVVAWKLVMGRIWIYHRLPFNFSVDETCLFLSERCIRTLAGLTTCVGFVLCTF